MSNAVQKWLKITRTELSTAKTLASLGLEHASVVLFLSQQVAEKSIKAYLTHKNKKIKKIHDLNELIEGIDDLELKESIKPCHFLTQYVAKFRYPQLIEELPVEADVSKALKIAESTYQTILKAING